MDNKLISKQKKRRANAADNAVQYHRLERHVRAIAATNKENHLTYSAESLRFLSCITDVFTLRLLYTAGRIHTAHTTPPVPAAGQNPRIEEITDDVLDNLIRERVAMWSVSDADRNVEMSDTHSGSSKDDASGDDAPLPTAGGSGAVVPFVPSRSPSPFVAAAAAVAGLPGGAEVSPHDIAEACWALNMYDALDLPSIMETGNFVEVRSSPRGARPGAASPAAARIMDLDPEAAPPSGRP